MAFVLAGKKGDVAPGTIREFQVGGIELEQQIVAERADQTQTGIVGVGELLDQRSKN